MPRVRTSTSDPLDFCRKCMPQTEAQAFSLYGNRGDGPDGRGNCFSFDDDHPDYGDVDYRCCKCNTNLARRMRIWWNNSQWDLTSTATGLE